MEVAMKRRVLTIDQHRQAAAWLEQAQEALEKVMDLIGDSDAPVRLLDRLLGIHGKLDLMKTLLDDVLVKAHGPKAPDVYWCAGSKQPDVLVVGEQPAKPRTPLTGVVFDK
jgi:hypothetical protein